MAFSTQKEFFHVPFLNENVTYECKKACVQLKSYESTFDDRAWARDEGKRSKFLSDLVNCKSPATTEDDECSLQLWNIPSGLKTGPEPSTASLRPASSAKLSGGDAVGLGVVAAGDSLLQCANVHLADYQKIKKIKVALEKELDVSNEKLKTANEEIVKIKEILNNKLDTSATKDFHNKIQKFIAGGKFTKNEENEMLQIYQKMENLCKAYEVVQAENNYLKRLIEKLSSRVKMEQITLDPETSTNVEHLQCEVNKLRKECMMLRAIEDDYNKMKQCARKSKCIRDQDAENIKAILKERDSLRQKCQSLNKMTGDMCSNLESQGSHIEHIECEMQKMQKYYEDQLEEANHTIHCLKAQVENLKDDIVNYKCQAQKAEILQTEVCCLRNEIMRRDIALNDYDCQYKQLMDVVNELQAMKLQCLEDNQTQTCNEEMDELQFYTRATLNEIKKEVKKNECADALKRLQELESENNRLNDHIRQKNEREDECADALKRLQELESENNRLNDQIRQKNEREDECAAALKRLKELESENSRNKDCIHQNDDKMCNMIKKIEQLEDELNRNREIIEKCNNEVSETKGLVADIGSMQNQNKKLTNAVDAINSRDDEKIIDDLRRQLQEEMNKLKKCQMENEALDKDMNDLKNLNKKLQNRLSIFQCDAIGEDEYEAEVAALASKKEKKHIDEFVNKNVGNLKSTFDQGCGLENELCKILNEFVEECCFSLSCFNSKSKFSTICHKLCLNGLNSLDFRELAYLHKKIFARAEQLLPGCLLDMILNEHKDEIQNIVMSHTSETMVKHDGDGEQICCRCRKELCCNESEELLQEKVTKLEMDIEMAREYLESLKSLPLDNKSSLSDFTDSTDANECPTYRPSMLSPKAGGRKQLRKLKSRILSRTRSVSHQ